MNEHRNNNDVEFSPREFAILCALLERPGAILSRSTLEDRLYGWQDGIESNAVEVHIHKLRAKLGAEFIQTVRGAGYKLAKGGAMNSIPIRLFLILLTATGVVWLSAVVWIQQSTRAEVERVLDARLAEAGQMVSSLISDQRIDVARAATIVTDSRATKRAAAAALSAPARGARGSDRPYDGLGRDDLRRRHPT